VLAHFKEENELWTYPSQQKSFGQKNPEVGIYFGCLWQYILRQSGCNENVAAILGAHHGKPPTIGMLISQSIDSYPDNFHLESRGKDIWASVQEGLIKFALRLSEFGSLKDIPKPNITGQVLLVGLVIMPDWIASNEMLVPLMGLEDSLKSKNTLLRAQMAWKGLGLTLPWERGNAWMNEKLYCQRFAFERSRPVQLALAEIASGLESPGILVLEAAMGVGKTEAALVAAEILAAKTKHKGIFFALPSQATSDAIFPRIANWVSKLDRLLGDEHYSLRLMPGKAEFNDHYCKLSAGANVDGDEENAVFVHSWFAGRKRSMLDDFVVGTIDQLLLAALKHKHLKLRHL
jgi:CRISPR-associated endonuclease/helicase Cas3